MKPKKPITARNNQVKSRSEQAFSRPLARARVHLRHAKLQWTWEYHQAYQTAFDKARKEQRQTDVHDALRNLQLNRRSLVAKYKRAASPKDRKFLEQQIRELEENRTALKGLLGQIFARQVAAQRKTFRNN